MESLLKDIVDIAKQAGQKVLEIYQTGSLDIQIKSDSSPLTQADMAAHDIIISLLKEKYPKIPCLSEESTDISFEKRKSWKQCFIIDPLDGTKEFIAGNGDFTINIALQVNGQCLLGVIYVPVADVVYFAAEGIGAFKQKQDQPVEKIAVREIPQRDGENHFTILASRRNGLERIEKLCKNFTSYQLINRGSSLKMCLVAEGAADFCPQLALTSEWDTAAAQAIVEQAGGKIVQLDFSEMAYNQKESLLNPYFLVLGDPNFDWKKELVIAEENR